MKLILKILIINIYICFNGVYIYAQDPHFTQFYNSPLTVNPAYTGVFATQGSTTNSRVLTNYRSQWNNSQSPYNTGTIQFDSKLGSQDDGNVIQNPFNLGLLCMYDQSLNGAFKSSYLMGTGSLNIPVGESGNNGFDGYSKSLGLGFGAVYGNRRVDLSQISFSQQFSSGGFDLSMPNGEVGLNNMKPFFSLNAGLLYQSISGEGRENEFKIGFSGYHLNKPKQTFYNDPMQIIPMRFAFQIEYLKRSTTNYSFLETKLIYQNQASINYLLLSAIYNINIGGNDYENSIGFGANYRLNDAISPYFALAISGFRFGCSYDITTSKLKTGLVPARSMEVSMQFILSKSSGD